MSENTLTDGVDLVARINAIEPTAKSWTLKILEVLPVIEEKLSNPGVTQQMVAETLGLKQSEFSVYLKRARDRHKKTERNKVAIKE